MYAMPVPVARIWWLVQKPSETVKTGNNHPLNLGGSRVELAGNRVPQITFHLVLSHVAVTAMDLDGVEAGLDACLTYVKFGYRSFAHRMPSLTLQPGCLVYQQSAGFEPDLHVRDLVGDSGILSDGLAELLPHARILHASFLQSLHHSQ